MLIITEAGQYSFCSLRVPTPTFDSPLYCKCYHGFRSKNQLPGRTQEIYFSGGPWNTCRSGYHYYLGTAYILSHLLVFPEEHPTQRWNAVHAYPLPPDRIIRSIFYWSVGVCNSRGDTSHRCKHALGTMLVVVFRPNIQLLVSAYYSHAAAYMITDCQKGMAPTLMVACIALAADDAHEAPSADISTFMFHARSTHVYLTQSVSGN